MVDPHIFISDLDGTLLDRKGQLPQNQYDALSHMLNQGLPFTIATARGLSGVRKVLGKLPISLPIIVRNGAWVMDLAKQEVLFSQLMEPQLGQALFALIKTHELVPAIAQWEGGREVMRGMVSTQKPMYTYGQNRAQKADPLWEFCEDLQPYFQHPVAQINIISYEDVMMDVEDDLRDKFGDRVMLHVYPNTLRYGWTMISILDKQATKGNATEWLLDQQNLDRKILTAFGDNDNDIDLLQLAGTAVVVDHARNHIKQHADVVLAVSNGQNVVKYIQQNWEPPS